MQIYLKLLSVLYVSIILMGCSEKSHVYNANNDKIVYSGRTEKQDSSVILIGPASSATICFSGNGCAVMLRNETPEGEYGFVAVELDGAYYGRIKIESRDMKAYPIELPNETMTHVIKIFKATEASTGNIAFGGIRCKSIKPVVSARKKYIEFIGNSITSAMGVDYTEIPCHTDKWYDQHNAYFSYATILSRKLDVDYLLSSVSGIGIYRNWNSVGPVMPVVYENLYLNLDSAKKRDFTKFNPDIVSICLGTNDFSDGDGEHERKSFNADAFVSNYIGFVETVYGHYPKTQVVLLSSPMLSGTKDEELVRCLNSVKGHFNNAQFKPIQIFEFSNIEPHGCDYHPDIDDQEKMAGQLYPFFRELFSVCL